MLKAVHELTCRTALSLAHAYSSRCCRWAVRTHKTVGRQAAPSLKAPSAQQDALMPELLLLASPQQRLAQARPARAQCWMQQLRCSRLSHVSCQARTLAQAHSLLHWRPRRALCQGRGLAAALSCACCAALSPVPGDPGFLVKGLLVMGLLGRERVQRLAWDPVQPCRVCHPACSTVWVR